MSYAAPQQIDAQSPDDFLEVMSKAVFQSGMSWKVINSKWPGISQAFRGFNCLGVAALTEAEMADLAQDPRIIRNRKKVEAVVDNARRIIELAEEHGGSFQKYLRSHGGFEDTVTDLRKNFKFLGDFGCFYFLYVVKEQVPSYDDWCRSRGRPHHGAAH